MSKDNYIKSTVYVVPIHGGTLKKVREDMVPPYTLDTPYTSFKVFLILFNLFLINSFSASRDRVGTEAIFSAAHARLQGKTPATMRRWTSH